MIISTQFLQYKSTKVAASITNKKYLPELIEGKIETSASDVVCPPPAERTDAN